MDTKLYRLYLLILIIPFTLVGGSTPLKILVSWDYYSQYIEKNVPHPQSVPYLLVSNKICRCPWTPDQSWFLWLTSLLGPPCPTNPRSVRQHIIFTLPQQQLSMSGGSHSHHYIQMPITHSIIGDWQTAAQHPFFRWKNATFRYMSRRVRSRRVRSDWLREVSFCTPKIWKTSHPPSFIICLHPQDWLKTLKNLQ